ncbi:unnamed protein product [Camellia sinensis]
MQHNTLRKRKRRIEMSKENLFIGSIDQGTISTRFILYDKNAHPIGSHQVEFTQFYPQAGDDPMEIIESVKICMSKAIDKAIIMVDSRQSDSPIREKQRSFGANLLVSIFIGNGVNAVLNAQQVQFLQNRNVSVVIHNERDFNVLCVCGAKAKAKAKANKKLEGKGKENYSRKEIKNTQVLTPDIPTQPVVKVAWVCCVIHDILLSTIRLVFKVAWGRF